MSFDFDVEAYAKKMSEKLERSLSKRLKRATEYAKRNAPLNKNIASFKDAATKFEELGGLLEVERLCASNERFMEEVVDRWKKNGMSNDLRQDPTYKELRTNEGILNRSARWLGDDIKAPRWRGWRPSLLQSHLKRARYQKDTFGKLLRDLDKCREKLAQIDLSDVEADNVTELVQDLQATAKRLKEMEAKHPGHNSAVQASLKKPFKGAFFKELGSDSPEASISGRRQHRLRRANSLADFRSELSRSSFGDSD
ncbi:hypothetical protein T439DRAFT_371200 [Meredithblackwellia eburnea MCA 4105]